MRWKHGTGRTDRAGMAGQLAWKLARIVDRGIELRVEGWCLGAPRPAQLTVLANGMVVSTELRLKSDRQTREHARRGHDDGCVAFGVSLNTARELTRAWDVVGAAPLLMEAFAEAAAEVRTSRVGWTPDRARDAFTLSLQARVTPTGLTQARAPRSDAAPQMPRSSSNAPSSRRCFIWVRKRAASAPSMIR